MSHTQCQSYGKTIKFLKHSEKTTTISRHMEKKNDIFEASSIIDARQNLYYCQIAIEVGIRVYI